MMPDNIILKVVAKWLIPMVLLFAFYVQFHGDYSPGGGFQAGVIFTSGFLLYAMVYGLDAMVRVIPDRALMVAACFGVLLYSGVGVASMLKGGEFLNYSALLESPVSGQHLGIVLIELGVGITVASVMLLLFITFARRVAPQ